MAAGVCNGRASTAVRMIAMIALTARHASIRGIAMQTVRSTDVAPIPRPAGLARVENDQPRIDLNAAEQAARQFLHALNIATDDETMRRTPRRMAKAYAELFTPRPFDLTTFPNDGGYDELVLAREIPFRSVCEHHLLPFFGKAAVGYLPAGRILGLSKLARVVEHFSLRPQVQERLTKQVADWLALKLEPKGVG